MLPVFEVIPLWIPASAGMDEENGGLRLELRSTSPALQTKFQDPNSKTQTNSKTNSNKDIKRE
jgi:hypothetical protein